MDLVVSEVKVAVLQTDILTGLCGSGYLERQALTAGTENLQCVSLELYHTGRELGVYCFLISLGNCTCYLYYSLLGHALEQTVAGQYYLSNAVVISQVKEDNAAMIADSIHPACQSGALTDVVCVQFITGVASKHIVFSFSNIFF